MDAPLYARCEAEELVPWKWVIARVGTLAACSAVTITTFVLVFRCLFG